MQGVYMNALHLLCVENLTDFKRRKLLWVNMKSCVNPS